MKNGMAELLSPVPLVAVMIRLLYFLVVAARCLILRSGSPVPSVDMFWEIHECIKF